MNKFSMWLFNFMRGRYGMDELNRFLGIAVIIAFIVSIVCGVVSMLAYDLARAAMVGRAFGGLSSVVNWVAVALLVWYFFRMLSRNHVKRRAENERFVAWRGKRAGGRGGKRANRTGGSSRASIFKGRAARGAEDNGAYDYLSCPFCGQRMRVPKGKGKIAVKCPSCGEKTIYNS